MTKNLLDRIETLYGTDPNCSYIAAEMNKEFSGGSPFSAREIRVLVRALEKMGRINSSERVAAADMEKRVFSLRMEGSSAKEIADQLGICFYDVRKVDAELTRKGLFPTRLQVIVATQRSRRRRAQWWVNNDRLVQSIVTLMRKRYSLSDIAVKEGISYPKLLEVVNRIRHKHGDAIFTDPDNPTRTLREASQESGVPKEVILTLFWRDLVPHEYREGKRPRHFVGNEGIEALKKYVSASR